MVAPSFVPELAQVGCVCRFASIRLNWSVMLNESDLVLEFVLDGGKNPTFQEKFVFSLIEGLREFSVLVWNSNTLTYDDFIGSGK